MSKFGLIGKHIDYSFSKSYFTKKFEDEELPHSYENFDINSIDEFPQIITNTKQLKGLNVTIPYKELVIPFLNKLDKKAKRIGAVNTIKITNKGELIGYNTDYYGFKKSIKPFLKPNHKKALILGTGGASKAIVYALGQLGIESNYVSRTKSEISKYTYNTLSEETIRAHHIIINCTPVGTFPNIDVCPKIPYNTITKAHLLYDLIYNPKETKFLKMGKQNGATICNGQDMLEFQAEKAWEIWNAI
jgi:shikimate dehydrogenase